MIRAAAASGLAAAAWLTAHQTSPLVRHWRPSSFARRRAGPLGVRDSGGVTDDARSVGVLVVLHGLGATGDYFGDAYDALSSSQRVLIVDLLGFGTSLDESRSDYALDDHLDALSTALEDLGLGDASVSIAAHSMSSALALAFAQRRPNRVQHVVLWGPPAYRTGSAEQSIGSEYGTMGRLLAIDETWARRACMLNCRNRTVSGWAMALAAPRWPTPVSRQASLHTWEAYHGSLQSLILDADWSSLLSGGVPTTVLRGVDDSIGDLALLESIPDIEVVEVPGADHHVALQRPDLLQTIIDQSS